MTSSIDKIMDSFPNPTISPIVGQPGYDTIAEMHLMLNANAASVQSHSGDGALGLLFLTIPPAVYNTISAIPFIPPPPIQALLQPSLQDPQAHKLPTSVYSTPPR